jgi:Zn-dependent protease
MDRLLEGLSDFAILGPPLLFVLIVSDVVRGWAAYRYGDKRPELQERLTLSPLAHFDLMGTLVLPLLLTIAHSPLLMGWTKPMPIVFSNLDHPMRDTVRVELIGLCTLLFMGFLGALGLMVVVQFVPETFYYAAPLKRLFQRGMQLPFVFFIFNMLPTPGRPITNILLTRLNPRQAHTLISIGPQLNLMVLIGLMSGLLSPIILWPAGFLIRLSIAMAQALIVAFLQILSLGGFV